MYSLFIPFNNTILIEMTLDMYLTVSNQRRIQHRTRLDQNSWASTVNDRRKDGNGLSLTFQKFPRKFKNRRSSRPEVLKTIKKVF